MKLLLTTLTACAIICEASDAKPNVLMIVVDDLRPELNCYGVQQMRTPAFDRLAKKGMLCERAYIQYPVCNPSRSSFLSGLRPNETGITSNETPFREVLPDLVSLPQLFRQNGYHTAGIGKIFHKGQDADGNTVLFQDPKSFDHFFDALHDVPAIGKRGEGRNLTDGRIPWCTWRAAEGDDEDQPDGINTTEALRVLDEKHEQPFFLALGIHKPHDPFVAPAKYFESYPKDETQLAQEPEDCSPRVSLAIPQGAIFDSFTDKERKEFKRAYQACVSFADAQVGRLLDAMDRHELWENTIVILIGDHGYHLGEHDWWNKVTVYELGARAPMIWWVPGEAGMGSSTNALIEFVDIYPTLIDYAGLEAPHKLSGQSLRPVFEDPSHAGKEAAFTHVNRGKTTGHSVRTDRWRYTEWGPDGDKGIELYDHRTEDPEYHNLADDPRHEATKKNLAELLETKFPETK